MVMTCRPAFEPLVEDLMMIDFPRSRSDLPRRRPDLPAPNAGIKETIHLPGSRHFPDR
jgi:hypothetical protein